MSEAYELIRDFNAPKALVWRALTEESLLSRWYGPGVETTIHNFDCVVGGLWLTEMKMGGNAMFQRADFTEVDRGTRFSCIQANTDADWNVIDNMMMKGMPRLLKLDVYLSDIASGTRLELTWTPHDASPEEAATFTVAMGQMGGGWSMGMDEVEKILTEIA